MLTINTLYMLTSIIINLSKFILTELSPIDRSASECMTHMVLGVIPPETQVLMAGNRECRPRGIRYLRYQTKQTVL